ncbi:MAG: A/G-specific adenine glycosylase [Clostridia bacterium]|nr:A/G-specific adenine glycosylase [Clostridia bacterium]
MRESTRLLLEWYDAERRILPWREDPTPYHVWLSEIMLQQTRVEAVKDYYARFLEALPDVAALAAADEDTYLKLWEGLGYYSRVRNLHKAAVVIMEEHDGVIPGTAKELQKLPGIGEYTAAAIASIAFGEPVSSVDGNLLRVFARRTLYRESVKDPAAKKAAFAYFMERMPEDRPGDYNQALMDLGATVCLPNGEPECFRCPWAAFCEAHQQGAELEVPVVPAKKARRVEHRTVFRVHCGEELLLARRPDTGLLAGLYEFPNTEDGVSPEAFLKGLGLTAVSSFPLPAAKHIFTHVEWRMNGFDLEVETLDPVRDTDGLFVVHLSELEKYSIPSAFDAFKY